MSSHRTTKQKAANEIDRLIFNCMETAESFSKGSRNWNNLAMALRQARLWARYEMSAEDREATS